METDVLQAAADDESVEHIMSLLNSGHLYYSSTYDLPHSLQHNQQASRADSKANIDNRYHFNSFFSNTFLGANKKDSKVNLSQWLIRVILGFAGSVDIEYKKATSSEGSVSPEETFGPTETLPRLYTITLISRENQRRLGTRYVRRGLDSQGNAANNVEMEQIVFHHDFAKHSAVASHVQLRGSAPAVWGQDLDLSYKPRLLIADIKKPEIWAPIEKHYKDMLSQYVDDQDTQHKGKIVCVNLLDTLKFEGPLTETYEETVKLFKSDRIDYEGESFLQIPKSF